MNTPSLNKPTTILCAVLAIFALAQPLYAYPPDNAAVLYYRASLVYESNDVAGDHPDILTEMAEILKTGRTGSEVFPLSKSIL